MVANRLNVDIVESEGKKDPRDYRVSFDKIITELEFETIHKPKESIEQIVTSLENGLIDENVLHESVNIKSD